jgi:DNA-damage-inducible protein D
MLNQWNIAMSELKAKEYKQFEDIKHVCSNGNEFWFARELAFVLNYK